MDFEIETVKYVVDWGGGVIFERQGKKIPQPSKFFGDGGLKKEIF